jgi:MFS family permease
VDRTSPPGEGLWAPRRRPLISGLVLSTTLIAAEALAVITIMPRIAHDLGGLKLYGWVFSSFMLTSLLGAVAAGRRADRAGPGGPFLAGLVLFATGLAVDGAAPSMGVLVLGRTLQGLGAGALEAIAYVAIGRALPEHLRPRMFAVLSTAWVLPGLLGPVLSAAVASLFGWRWVFVGLLPILALGGALAVPALRGLGPPPARASAEHRLSDAILVVFGSALLLAGLGLPSGPAGIALALAGLVVTLVALRRLLPGGTLRARAGLPAVILGRGLLTFAFFGADAFVTLTITTALGHSPAIATLAITGSTLAWTAGSWLQVRLHAEREGRALIRAGMLMVLMGIAGVAASLLPGVTVALAVASWTLAGFGIGLAYSPSSLMMLEQAPPGREGWASASLNLSDLLGTALGTGIGGAAIAAGTARGWSISSAVAVAFAIAAAGAIAGLIASARLPLQGLAGGRGEPGGLARTAAPGP